MKVHVFVDIEGRTHLAGHLYTDQRRGRLTSVFAYDDSYLTDPAAYPIDPALPLGRGTWPSTSTLPRAILDASPDRWGRTLIARRAAATHATSVAGAATGPTVMSALISAAPRFGLRADRVRQELRVLLQAVSRWDGVAATHHVSRDERARFAPVFESGTESVRQGLAAVVQGG